jgi:hypothetical protein
MTIPRSTDLSSDVLIHSYDDMFNPPGLTNFLGTARVDLDVFAVRSINFPPYSHRDKIRAAVRRRPDARLRGLRVGSRSYDVTAAGVVRA